MIVLVALFLRSVKMKTNHNDIKYLVTPNTLVGVVR